MSVFATQICIHVFNNKKTDSKVKVLYSFSNYAECILGIFLYDSNNNAHFLARIHKQCESM